MDLDLLEDVMRSIWRWWVRWMSCDGLGVVGQGTCDGFGGGGSGRCHVMDLGWVRRMSCGKTGGGGRRR